MRSTSGVPGGWHLLGVATTVVLAAAFTGQVWAWDHVPAQEPGTNLYVSLVDRLGQATLFERYPGELDCYELCEHADDFFACVEQCQLNAQLMAWWDLFGWTHAAQAGADTTDLEAELIELVATWLASASAVDVEGTAGFANPLDTPRLRALIESFHQYAVESTTSGEASNRTLFECQFYVVAFADALVAVVERDRNHTLRVRLLHDIFRMLDEGDAFEQTAPFRVGLFSAAARLASTPDELNRLDTLVAAYPELEQELYHTVDALELFRAIERIQLPSRAERP